MNLNPRYCIQKVKTKKTTINQNDNDIELIKFKNKKQIISDFVKPTHENRFWCDNETSKEGEVKHYPVVFLIFLLCFR